MTSSWRFRISGLLVIATILLLPGGLSRVFPLAGIHPVNQPVNGSDWPDGMNELINGSKRVAGVWINANDTFYFEGDTSAFNRFLEAYSRIPDVPLRVAIHRGPRPSEAFLGDPRRVSFDWSLSLTRDGWGGDVPAGYAGKYLTGIDVWVGDRIDLEGMAILGPLAPLIRE